MPVALATPLTLATKYNPSQALGPYQNLEKIVFTTSGGVTAFQVAKLDPTGKANFDQGEGFVPAGTWGFEKIYGIQFRSRDAGTLATIDPVTGYFDDDPDPYNPGNIPTTATAVTGTVNVDHNGALVGTRPTINFADSADGSFAVTVVDNAGASRVDVTFPNHVASFNGRDGVVVPTAGDYLASQVTNAADKASASNQVFTGDVVAGTSPLAAGGGPGSQLHTTGTVATGTSTSAGNAFTTTVTGDTQFRFSIQTSGLLQWGSGAAVPDVNLQRTGAAILTTNGSFSTGPVLGGFTGAQTAGALLNSGASPVRLFATTATTVMFTIGITTDTQPRFEFDANGLMSWGAGGATAVDTSLQRSSGVPPSSGQVGLATQQAFYSTNTTGGFVYAAPANNSAFLSFLLASDANPAFKIFTQGAIEWGPGGASALDIELARTTPSTGTGASLLLIAIPGGFGYGTGAGGAATQVTNKSQTVTINKPSGKITFNAAALAAGATALFTLSNTVIGLDDCVVFTPVSNAGGIVSEYIVLPCADSSANTAGQVRAMIQNIGTGSGSDAVVCNFVVIKGAHS